jgi:DNA-binding MarR family transcriptional regulator
MGAERNMEKEVRERIAQRIVMFMINMSCWSAGRMRSRFNINGKGGLELSERQFGVLLVIKSSGMNTITELEKAFGISKSSLSLTIKKMEQNGLVEKKQFASDNDGRVYHIVITKAGEEILEKFIFEVVDSISEYLTRFPDDMLSKIEGNISDFDKLMDSKIFSL